MNGQTCRRWSNVPLQIILVPFLNSLALELAFGRVRRIIDGLSGGSVGGPREKRSAVRQNQSQSRGSGVEIRI